jgi:hypothetical protein
MPVRSADDLYALSMAGRDERSRKKLGKNPQQTILRAID